MESPTDQADNTPPRMEADLTAWRRAQRARLLACRQTIPHDDRAAATALITAALDRLVAQRKPRAIGFYWPIRLEPNLLDWARATAAAGGPALCLPVVVTPKTPLEYWLWTPGSAMAKGFWNIPVPAERHPVLPDLIIAPLVGFDTANYRLGYGGGYFDRTLAAASPRPFAVGVGMEFALLDTIFPQPHDIPMDIILTERRPSLAAGPTDHGT